MHISVVPVFGTHGIGVVGCCEIAPSADEAIILCSKDTIAQCVEVMSGRMLHGIRSPSGKVTFGVGPSDSVWHGDVVGGGHEVAGFGDSDKFVVIGAEPFWDEGLHEIKDTGVFPLMLAEGLEIHEEIDERTAQTVVIDPVDVFGDGEWPLTPAAIRETKRDVVGQAVILKE